MDGLPAISSLHDSGDEDQLDPLRNDEIEDNVGFIARAMHRCNPRLGAAIALMVASVVGIIFAGILAWNPELLGTTGPVNGALEGFGASVGGFVLAIAAMFYAKRNDIKYSADGSFGDD